MVELSKVKSMKKSKHEGGYEFGLAPQFMSNLMISVKLGDLIRLDNNVS